VLYKRHDRHSCWRTAVAKSIAVEQRNVKYVHRRGWALHDHDHASCRLHIILAEAGTAAQQLLRMFAGIEMYLLLYMRLVRPRCALARTQSNGSCATRTSNEAACTYGVASITQAGDDAQFDCVTRTGALRGSPGSRSPHVVTGAPGNHEVIMPNACLRMVRR